MDESSEFNVAITCDDIITMDKLLGKNVDLLNTGDCEGVTPIFRATDNLIDIETFKYLLQRGADINHKDKAGRTILQYIFDNFETGCYDVERILTIIPLVNDGVCLTRNYRNMSLFHYIDYIHNSQYWGLRRKGCRPCKQFLQCLIERNVPANCKDITDLTPMHKAISCGCLVSMKVLLKTGVNVDIANDCRYLHSLCLAEEWTDFKPCLTFLLQKGCSINQKSKSGENALHIAMSGTPMLEKLKFLVKKGVQVQCRDNIGNTVIHQCAISLLENALETVTENEEKVFTSDHLIKKERQCLKFLHSQGISINAQNAYGFTALHYAAETQKIDIVSTLLELGADINVKAYTGETPLHKAVMDPHTKSLEMIFQKQAPESVDLGITDNYQSTPAHWAMYHGNMTLFSLQPGLTHKLHEMIDCKGRDPIDLSMSLHGQYALRLTGIASEHSDQTPVSQDHNYSKLSHPSAGKENKSSADSPHYLTDILCVASSSHDANVPLHVLDEATVMEGKGCDTNFDVFGHCPILTLINEDVDIMAKEKIPLDQWNSHLVEHKSALSEFFDIVIDTEFMGLYYDIAENKQIESAVDSVMRIIGKRLGAENTVFDCNVVLKGSCRERTKVGFPNEFDYVFELIRFESAFVPEESDSRGFSRLKLGNEDDYRLFHEYIDENGYLDAVQFIPKIYSLINTVIDDSTLMKHANLYPCKRLNPQSFSIDSLAFRWVGATYKDLEISVDIVLSIGLGKWVPKCVNVSSQLLKAVNLNSYVSVVFKTQDPKLMKGWSTYFRISISSLEVAVLGSVPLPILKGYIIVKALKDSGYFPLVNLQRGTEGHAEFLTTYMVKCTFLHELEDSCLDITRTNTPPGPHETHCRRTSIEWARRIIRRLLKCIEDKRLPEFFMNENDFLRDWFGQVYDTNVNIGRAQCVCLQKLIDCADRY